MWVRTNFGRGDVIDISKCKVIYPRVEETCRTDESGKEKCRTVYVIYADDMPIFRTYDKEEAQLTFEWLISKVMGVRSMKAIAMTARHEHEKEKGGKQ